MREIAGVGQRKCYAQQNHVWWGTEVSIKSYVQSKDIKHNEQKRMQSNNLRDTEEIKEWRKIGDTHSML